MLQHRRPLQKSEADRKRDTKPSRTLFVVNFDVRRTTERDIERYFGRFGRLTRVQVRLATGVRRAQPCSALRPACANFPSAVPQLPLSLTHTHTHTNPLIFVFVIQIKKSYSFVQFQNVEDAIKAMERANGAQMEGRTLAVEYVQVGTGKPGRDGDVPDCDVPHRHRTVSEFSRVQSSMSTVAAWDIAVHIDLLRIDFLYPRSRCPDLATPPPARRPERGP